MAGLPFSKLPRFLQLPRGDELDELYTKQVVHVSAGTDLGSPRLNFFTHGGGTRQ